MSDELRKRIDNVFPEYIQNLSARAAYVESIMAIIREHEDNRYSGLDAESRCPQCQGHDLATPCYHCEGTGTIRRQLPNKEALEIPKMLLNETAGYSTQPHIRKNPVITLPSGERVVVGGE